MNLGNKLKILLLFVGDIAALYVGLFLALVIRYGTGFYAEFINVHAIPFTIIFIPWLLVFYIAGLYDLRRLRNNLDFLKTLSLSLVVNALFTVLVFYLVPAFGIAPKTNLLIFILVFAIVEILWRRLFNRIVTSGEAPNSVLLVGSSPIAEEMKVALRINPQLGYSMKAEMDEEAAYASPESVATIARREKVNLVVIPEHLKHESRLVRVLYELFGEGIFVNDLAHFYELIMRKVPLADLEEAWFLENIAQGGKFYDPLKRASELLFALILGIILLPIELLIAILVVTTSRGPAIYRQVRVGEKNKTFTLYKFRTMRMDAERHGPQWANTHDTRATFIGQLLRKSHLDELPQLWNIIRGELSFVGPRPERPEFVQDLQKKIPYYEVRLLIKPGVTGWAQINYHKDTTIEDVKEKLQYDIYYLKNRALILDWAIIVKTLKSIFVTPE